MTKGFLSVILILGGLLLQLTPVRALEGDMATEFAYLSGQTRQALQLSLLELGTLVERCDRLLEQTEKLQGSEKKVMHKKIERLRALFFYVLSVNQEGKEENIRK